MRVLLTGASGFIGKALALAMAGDEGVTLRTAYRVLPSNLPRTVEACVVSDLSPATDWRAALDGVDVVVHLAGTAHANLPRRELQRAIVGGTTALALQSERAGIRRLIYVSSIKAAATTSESAPLRETDAASPRDDYGCAKAEAELEIAQVNALRPVLLRPPLVHAADAKANFASLLRLASLPAPLPLGGIRNRRSVLSRKSLIGAITSVLAAPDGPSGVFHLADRPSLSTTEIAYALRAGMGRNEPLFECRVLWPFLPKALLSSCEVDDTLFRERYGYGAGGVVSSRALVEATAREWARRS